MGFARARHLLIFLSFCLIAGCATMKESDTARTGVEQLLISSAVDRALDNVDLRPIAGANVFLDSQYLDCTDKNYVIVAMHQRLLRQNCRLVDKADGADVIVEVASGAVGTDRNELFLGVPQIPLPPPSPISIPKVALVSRTKAMGTVKLSVVAIDVKTKRPVVNSGYVLARSDYRNFSVLGAGGTVTGSVPTELAHATGESESIGTVTTTLAAKKSGSPK